MIALRLPHRQTLRRALASAILFGLFFDIALPQGIGLMPAVRESLSIPVAKAAEGIFNPINYQGKITGSGGTSIANGQYNMRFKIFSGALLGDPLWIETWSGGTVPVTMTGGLFTVQLGTFVSFDGFVDFNSDSLFLQTELDVNGDNTFEEVFSPRQRFTSVPYAQNARRLGGLEADQFLRSDADDTATGALTLDQDDEKTALTIDSEATTMTGVLIMHAGDESTRAAAALAITAEGGAGGLFISRNQTGSVTDDVLILIEERGTSDQDVVKIINNGTGSALRIEQGNQESPALDVTGTISGSFLVLSGLPSCAVLSTTASGHLVCGSAESLTMATADDRYVNISGDTMTGLLVIDRAGTGLILSGASLIMSLPAIREVGTIKDGIGATALNFPTSVTTVGRYAYVASPGANSLSIFDISEPTNPVEVGTIVDGAGATRLEGAVSVSVAGRYAYVVSTTDSALSIIDISDPTNPTEVGTISDTDGATELEFATSVIVVGRYAYATSNADSALSIFDISDPTNPTEVGTIKDGVGATDLSSASHVTVVGSYAYVAGGDTLTIIDISDPTNPTEVGTITDGAGATELGSAVSVAVVGRYAYVASNTDDSLSIIDISDPANPTQVGVIKDGVGATQLDGARFVTVAGRYAYVTSFTDDSLSIIDISNPANPTEVRTIKDGVGATQLDSARSVAVSGRYAYAVAANDNALSVFEISGIDAPAATIGALEAGTLDVSTSANIRQLIVDSSLLVGGGIQVFGPSAITGTGSVSALTIRQYNSAFPALNVVGTASGRQLFAQDLLTTSGALVVVGSAMFRGNVTLGDSTSDTVEIVGRISGSLIPTQTNSFDLGSDALRWRDLYLSGGTIYMGESGEEGIISFDGLTNTLSFDVNGDGTANFNFSDGADAALSVQGSVSGSTLIFSGLPNCSTLATSGTGLVICGSSSEGISQSAGDDRYVNVGGDTMTGFLTINATGTGLILSGGSLLIENPSATIVSQHAIGDGVQSIAIAGNYVYLADQNSSDLKIVDVTDPAAASTIATVAATFPAGVDVAGNYAYLADYGSDNLRIIDVSSPANPVVIGSVALGARPRDVKVQGRYAYVIDSTSDDLKVIDVSLPSRPIVVGAVSIGTDAVRLEVAGRYAYIIDFGSDDLKVIDLIDPTKPTIVDSLALGSNPESISVIGRYAYIVDSTSDDIKVIDISDPTTTSVVGSLALGDNPVAMDVAGRYAYITDTVLDELVILDVSNPTAPVMVRTLSLGGSANAEEIVVAGRYAYIADNGVGELMIVALSGIDAPTARIGSIEAGGLHVRESAYIDDSLDVGSSLFVGGGIQVFGPSAITSNATGATALTIRGSGSAFPALNVVGTASGRTFFAQDLLASSGSLIIEGTARLNGALTVAGSVTFSALTNCTSLASTSTGMLICSSGSSGISQSEGDDRYVNISGDTMTGFLVINKASTGIILSGGSLTVQHPQPVIVGGVKDATNLDGPFSVAVAGRYAYAASFFDDSLRIIDISDPTSPSIIGGVKDATNLDGAYSVAVAGRYAYVANANDDSLRIIEISNPTSPVIVGGVKDATNLNGAISVAVAGRYAYVASTNDDSLRIIDISNPTSPVIVGGVKDATNLDAPYSVAVAGRYAYVANTGDNSLRIIDISDPTAPVIVGGVQDASNLNGAISVAVVGRYAYVVNGIDDSLRIIDISDPTSPVIVGGVKDETNLDAPYSVAVAGRYAYVANVNDDSLRIIDISDPTSPVIVGGIKDATNLSDAAFVAIAGRYAYVASSADDSIRIIDIPGVEAPTARIGSAEIGDLYVVGSARVDQQFDVGDTLFVGGGIQVFGPSAITSNATGATALTIRGSGSAFPALNVVGTASGRTFFAQDLLASSGSLIIEGTARLNGALTVAGSVAFSALTNCTSLASTSTGMLICNSSSGISQSEGDDRYVNISGDTMTGFLVINKASTGIILSGGSLTVQHPKPVLVGTLALATSTDFSIAVAGNYAYIADRAATPSLTVVDITNPATPATVGSLGISFQSESLVVAGRYVYVLSSGFNGLEIYDVYDQSSPVRVGGVFVQDNLTEVRVAGRYAYASDVENGNLVIIDISDPYDPLIVASLQNIYSESFDVAGEYAYSVEGSTFEVINISNPTEPSFVGTLAIGSSPTSVRVAGRYAYVVDSGSDDLKIIDVSDPSAPTTVGTVSVGTEPTSVFISGRYAYVVDSGSDDVKVIDISDPTAPVVVGSLAIGSEPNEIVVAGRYAYVVDGGSDDLKIIDIPGIEAPTARIGSAEIGDLQVTESARIDNNLNIGSALFVGGGIQAFGPSAFSASNTGTSVLRIVGSYSGETLASFGLPTLEVIGTIAGTSLVLSGLQSCSSVATSATGVLICATDGSSFTQESADDRYVNVSGDTMTGLLIIDAGMALTVSGSATIGYKETDVLEFVSRISGSLVPTATNTYDLGSSALRWKDLYLSGGTIYMGNSTEQGVVKYQTTGTGGFTFDTNADGTVDVVIQSGGRVGVGTVTPVTQLDIAGYGASTRLAGSLSVDTGAVDVDVQGRYAYVVAASTSDTLKIYDVAERTPRLLGSISVTEDPREVVVQGNYAYVITYDGTIASKLRIFDVRNPASPRAHGIYNFSSDSSDLAVAGRYAYVTRGVNGEGITVINIENPDVPVAEGVLSTSALNIYSKIQVIGDYAVLSGGHPLGSPQLTVVDISNPRNLKYADQISTNQTSMMTADDRYIYELSKGIFGSSTLKVYDWSDRSNITQLSSLTTVSSAASEMVVRGRYLFVIYGSTANSMQIYDVSNPRGVSLVGTVSLGSAPTGIDVQGRYAYIVNSTSSELRVLDLGGAYIQQLEAGGVQVDQLVVRSDIDVLNDVTVGGALAVTRGIFVYGPSTIASTVTGASALTLRGSGTLFPVLNVVGTASGRTLFASDLLATSGALIVEGTALLNGALTVAGSVAFSALTNCTALTSTSTGMLICSSSSGISQSAADARYVNTSGDTMTGFLTINKASTGLILSGGSLRLQHPKPTITSSLTLGVSPRSVAVAGRYAYAVGQAGSGFSVIDVSNPSAPAIVGKSLSIGTGYRSIAVAGRYAYAVDINNDRLTVIDVYNPSSPVIVSHLGIGPFPLAIAVAGRYAYVTDVDSNDLKVIDISNPAAPAIVGTLTVGSFPLSIAVASNYAYVVDQSSDDLRVIDISNPTSPITVGTLAVSTTSTFVSVSGRYAYVTDLNGATIRVIDISRPSAPVSVSTLSLNAPQTAFVAGRYAYVVGSGTPNFSVVDTAIPSAPATVGTLAIGGGSTAASIVVSGRYAYVVDVDVGDLKIIDIPGVEAPTARIGALEAGSLTVDADARIENDLDVGSSLFVGGGIQVFGPSAITGTGGVSALTIRQYNSLFPALNVVGTASGRTLFASDLLASSGSLIIEGTARLNGALTVAGSVAFSALTSCTSLASTSTGMLICGSGGGSNFGTGNVLAIGDSRYVNTSGDTMTGMLILNPDSGAALELHSTVSGSILPSVTNTFDLGSDSNRFRDLYLSGGTIDLGGAQMKSGAGTPEGVATAAVGSLYLDTTNGSAYIKSTGAGNTGWTELGAVGEFTGTDAAAVVLKTVDESVASSTALQNDNELAFSVAANRTVTFEFHLLTSVNKDSGIKFAITAPNGSTCAYGATSAEMDADTSSATQTCGVAIVPSQDNGVATQVKRGFLVQGSIITSDAAGTITLQWAQNVSDPSAASVLSGSYIVVRGAGTSAPGSLSSDDADSRYVQIQGDTMTGGLLINLNGSAGATIDTGIALEVVGTASGRTLFAQDLLASSGSLIVEGTALLNGALTVAGSVAFSALTSCTSLASTSTGMLICGSGSSGLSQSEADDRYVNVEGDTMTGMLVINKVGTGLILSGGSFVISHPTLREVGTIKDGVGATQLSGAIAVAVAGRYAYVASVTDDSLSIIDVSDPGNPTEVGTIKDGVGATQLDGIESVAVAGRYAYAASREDDSLSIIDISDPSNPTEVGTIKDGVGATEMNNAAFVTVAGRYAYVISYIDASLSIIDISDPSNPTEVGTIKDGVGATEMGGAQGVTVVGRYAYVASRTDSSLSIIDISDPSNPTEVGTIVNGAGATELLGAYYVTVVGRYAYVASFDEIDHSLSIIDISDPSNPTEVGVIKDGIGATQLGGADSVVVAGRYAYVTGHFDHSLSIIDISDPSNPTEVSTITDGVNAAQLDGATSVAVAGRHAYVASYGDGSLSIIEISGIEAPAATIGAVQAGTLDVSTFANIRQLTVDSSLFVGGGIQVFGPSAITSNATGATALTIRGSGAAFPALNVVGTASGRHLYAQDLLTTSGALIVEGVATFNGNVVIGDSTSDILELVSRVSGSIIPNITDSFDLGSDEFRFRDLYLSGGTISMGSSGDDVVITSGNGTPESLIEALPGSLYMDKTNGTLYVKESGVSTTGWVELGGSVTNNNETQVFNNSVSVSGSGLPFTLQVNGNIGPASAPVYTTQSRTVTQISDADAVGDYISMAIAPDGFPIISYENVTDTDIMVSKCLDSACTAVTTTQFHTEDVDGGEGQITIGSDGLPIIAYRNNTDTAVDIIKCHNTTCTQSGYVQANDASLGISTSIAIGSDGFPVIVTRNTGDSEPSVIKCTSLDCSTYTFTNFTTDTGDVTPNYITINPLGFPAFVGRDGTLTDPVYYSCNDLACATFTKTVYTTASNKGNDGSLAFGPDGLAFWSYRDGSSNDLNWRKCNNIACTTSTEFALVVADDEGNQTSVANAPDGFPIIVHGNDTDGDIVIEKCRVDASCNSQSRTQLAPSGDDYGNYSQVAIGADGLPIIVTRNGTDDDIVFIKCVDTTCSATTGSVAQNSAYLGAGGGARGGGVPFAAVNTLAINNPTSYKNLDFMVNGITRMTVSQRGIVGIAYSGGTLGGNVLNSTNIPAGSLVIGTGIICVDDGNANCDDAARTAGAIYAATTSITAIDLAEQYPTEDSTLGSGTVVALDSNNPIFVRRATGEPDEVLLGIVSTKPGILLGGFAQQQFAGEMQVPVALAGRVPVKVTTENGDIAVGDPLTLSRTLSGTAMKMTSSSDQTIGIALEAYSGATLGEVQVYVKLSDKVLPKQSLAIDSETTSGATTLLEIISDVGEDENLVFRVNASGAVFTDGPISTTGADYAEWFYDAGHMINPLKKGDLVCIDITQNRAVKRCDREADGNVIGIISTNPAFIGNQISGALGITPPGYVLVGLIGQVPAKVLVQSGASIRPGDSLTPALTPGYARRAGPGEPTVGIALDGLVEGQGTVLTLISRRNSSVTVETVEAHVLETIKDMEIEDEVQLLIADAVEAMDLTAQVEGEVAAQVDALGLSEQIQGILASFTGSLITLEDRIAALEAELEDALSRPVSTSISTTGDLTMTGSLTLSGSIRTASGLVAGSILSERAVFDDVVAGLLTVQSDAMVLGELTVQGAMSVLSLSVAHDLVIGGTLHAAALRIQSGAVIGGELRVMGRTLLSGALVIGSGAMLSASGGVLDAGSLIIRDALTVLRNLTLSGMTLVLGTTQFEGEIIVSGRLAGYAVIPATGTSVTVMFDQPFSVMPIVTAVPNDFTYSPWRVTDRTPEGFTLELQSAAPSDISFSWTAVGAMNPRTTVGERPLNGVEFPVDANGVPLSTSAVWNACIRNQVTLDPDGLPYSCTRYHQQHEWMHPDLEILFTWNTEMSPALILPQGFVPVIEEEDSEETEDSEDAEDSEETEDAEDSEETEEAEESDETDEVPVTETGSDIATETGSEIPTDDPAPATEEGSEPSEEPTEEVVPEESTEEPVTPQEPIEEEVVPEEPVEPEPVVEDEPAPIEE